jgi:alpha-beta hydrolase superfamily lysophospholipase
MFPRRSKRLLASALGAAAVVVAGACTQVPPAVEGGDAPPGDAIYRPPTPLRGSAPGDLQWYRSVATSKYPDADVYVVLYRSIDALGQPMAVSGSVLVPKAAYTRGPRPIVGFAAATVGLTDDCAPSRSVAGDGTAFLEGNNVKALLAKGWAVALTDYQGLGTPGGHAYMVGGSQSHAVLDAVRAATRVPGGGLSTDAPVLLWGYSQGGAAAARAAEIATAYAPELSVKGTAVGGVPGDSLAVYAHLNGTYYGLALASAIGHAAVFPELDIQQILKPAGKTVVAQYEGDKATGGCITNLIVNYVGKRTTDYFTVDPTTIPAWRQRFEEDKIGTERPAAPVYQYHGSLDEIIPNQVGQDLRKRWCALGANVQFNGSMLGEHLSVALTGAGSAVTFLSDRVDGKPSRRTC